MLDRIFYGVFLPPPLQQCRALTAVACVAKTAEAKFGKYYDSFIPGIKAIVMATAPTAGKDPQVRIRGQKTKVTFEGHHEGREGRAFASVGSPPCAKEHSLNSSPYNFRVPAFAALPLIEPMSRAASKAKDLVLFLASSVAALVRFRAERSAPGTGHGVCRYDRRGGWQDSLQI